MRDNTAAWLAKLHANPHLRLVGDPRPAVPEPRPALLCAACARLLTAPADALSLTLPYPPSLNHLYVPVARGKLVLSQAGRDYHVAAAVAVTSQYPTLVPLTGRLAVTLIMHAPDRRVRDSDDIEKIIWDALQAAGVYRNDGQIDDRRVLRGTRAQPPYVQVTLAELQKGGPRGCLTPRPDA